jgi:D-galacturonate reductase
MPINVGIDVLIVGGGMYVSGKGTTSDGTIMPALLEARRHGLVNRLGLVTTTADSANENKKRVHDLAQSMGVENQCEFFPKSGRDTEAYLSATEQFKPDAVIVSVPDHLHASVSIPLIEKGLHCLVVKPMAPSMAEAEAMTEAAKKVGVVAQVEFHKRLDESNLLLRDAIQSGKLGSLLYAVIEYSQKKQIPRDIFHTWAEKTTIFQYLGVHYVDLLQFVTLFRPMRVSAWGQKDYLKNLGLDTWDAMQVVIEWERGDGGVFVSTHITNWIDPDETSAVSDQKINVVGTKGRFQADQKNRGVQIVEDGQGIQDVNPYFSTSRKDAANQKLMFNGYGIKSVLQFVEDVQMFKIGEIELELLEKSRPSFKVCRISTAVIEAAHQSLTQQNIPIRVQI